MNLKFWNNKVVGWTYRHIQRWVFQHDLAVERQYRYDDCVAKFRERLIKNNIPVNQPAPGEEEYIRFWQQFDKRVEPYTYRNFVRIIGQNPHIIPEDIGAAYIESILNPLQYRMAYQDKNLFPLILHPSSIFPKTYVCRMNGGSLMNGCYVSLKINGLSTKREDLLYLSAENIAANIPSNKCVLKPTVDSYGGANVMLLHRENNFFVDANDKKVDGEYLVKYGDDFVIQEVIEQHPYLAQFCNTSCNTIRVMTYRSVKDESINIFGAALRIGHNGSFVDNITSGGGRVMIDCETGVLGKIVYDKYSRDCEEINGVNFAFNTFRIPFWTEICNFAKFIGLQIPYCRLISMDVTYDVSNTPRLIEINIGGFCWSTTMYGGHIPFGNKFDEVIEYCLRHKM